MEGRKEGRREKGKERKGKKRKEGRRKDILVIRKDASPHRMVFTKTKKAFHICWT